MDEARLVYLDHAATTPVCSTVLEAMMPFFQKSFGNPSSLYPLAADSRRAIENARSQVAEVLNCRSSEVVFNSGGTESDNSAIRGVAQALRARGNHIITSSIEHYAVLNVCHSLEKDGFNVTYLPVDGFGLINPSDVSRAVTERTILVSIMYANNEIGTVERIKEVSMLLRERADYLGYAIPFHTDAVQAAGFLDLDVQELGVDLLSLSAHKFYGPKGCGVLYIRTGTPYEPTQFGGSQEQGRRAGTENTAGIVGTATALHLAAEQRQSVSEHCLRLRDTLIQGILARLHGTKLNGHPTLRLPNNAHFVFEGVDGEALIMGLALRGIAASTGSACSAGSLGPSHVLEAIGLDRELTWGNLRLSLGRDSSSEDVHQLLDAVEQLVHGQRAEENDFPVPTGSPLASC